MKFFVGFKQFRVDVHFANFGQVETDPICSFFTDFGEVTVILLSWEDIPHFNKLLYTFCVQNLAGIVFFLFCIQNVAMQKFVKMRYTLCIHFAYILYASVVYLLCNFCIQNVYTVSKWVINKKTFSIKKYLPIQSMISSSSKKSKPL